MAVTPTNSASSIQALQQYRETKQSSQGQQQTEQAATQDRVSIRSRQSNHIQRAAMPQQTPQTQRSEAPNRREAVAAYENANRVAQQAQALEKPKEKALRATLA